MIGLCSNEDDVVPGQFTGQCWRCWPRNGCKCPPDANEVEMLKSERLIAEMALGAERKRRRMAEAVLAKILDDAGSGEISLGDVISAARQHFAAATPCAGGAA